MIHPLKTWQPYLDEVAHGRKTFELRKSSDRDFSVGDTLMLREYDPTVKLYGNKQVNAEITYIRTGTQFGLQDGYSVLGLKVIEAIDYSLKPTTNDNN